MRDSHAEGSMLLRAQNRTQGASMNRDHEAGQISQKRKSLNLSGDQVGDKAYYIVEG